MPKQDENWNVADLRVGQRVARKNGELGTILEIADRIKVKWDGGRTSYFFRDLDADLIPAPAGK